MSPERWQQIKKVLNAALEQPPNERGAYIVFTCGDDIEIRREVEALGDEKANSGVAGAP